MLDDYVCIAQQYNLAASRTIRDEEDGQKGGIDSYVWSYVSDWSLVDQNLQVLYELSDGETIE